MAALLNKYSNSLIHNAAYNNVNEEDVNNNNRENEDDDEAEETSGRNKRYRYDKR